MQGANHRQALGYGGRGAPQSHPEYLFARRENRLLLNLVDVADPSFIRRELIDAALSFIHECLQRKRRRLFRGKVRSLGFLRLSLLSRVEYFPG
jgi:hypothetical protein